MKNCWCLYAFVHTCCVLVCVLSKPAWSGMWCSSETVRCSKWTLLNAIAKFLLSPPGDLAVAHAMFMPESRGLFIRVGSGGAMSCAVTGAGGHWCGCACVLFVARTSLLGVRGQLIAGRRPNFVPVRRVAVSPPRFALGLHLVASDNDKKRTPRVL